MDQPLVSFAIPFYNHNHFITHTLDSIFEDSYPNKEIIIKNDGSSNPDDSNSTKWIEKHSEQISIEYISRENKGVTKTLNELITLTHGKYIVLVASDDYLINNTVSDRVALLESRPDKLMLVSDAIVVDDNNIKTYDSAMFEQRGSPKENYFSDKDLKKEIIKRWSVVGPTWFISKKLFDVVGNFDEEIIIEDWDFYLRVVAKDLLLFYDNKVAAYRWHEDNTSKDPKSEYARTADLARTAHQNIMNFSFPYNYYLWRRYRSWNKKLKKIPKV